MIHYTNIRTPKSLQDFLAMNAQGETSNPNGFQLSSTYRAPWHGNKPGEVNSPARDQFIDTEQYQVCDDEWED